ncbi:hypothetical protein AAVH_13321 [Aphelenchoides avenae]|nr:hypothetical protein AAVH_13321 [Aphelenchus avenae]
MSRRDSETRGANTARSSIRSVQTETEHSVLVVENQGGEPGQMATTQVLTGKSLRGITDEKAKKLVVITEIGVKAYMELMNALEGKELNTIDTANDLLKLLKKRYSPRKLLIAERHRMLLLHQEAGQSLAEFYSRIQEAANKCELKTTEVREMMVVQVFVKCIRKAAQVLEMAEAEGHGMTDGQGQIGVHRAVVHNKTKSQKRSKNHYKKNMVGKTARVRVVMVNIVPML